MKLIKLLCVMILALVIGNVTLANQSLDQSVKMAQVASQMEELTKEVSILEATLAQSSSLAQIMPKIEALGFVAPGRILSVDTTAIAVASR